MVDHSSIPDPVSPGGAHSAGASSVRDRAIDFAMAHEGGLVDHPSDPGGITNYGVSLRYARNQGVIRGVHAAILLNFDLDNDGDIDADDIRLLTPEKARLVYIDIWNRFGFAGVADRHIAAKFFDLALPMGYGGASRVLQRALRACRLDVVEDGYVGPVSRRVINEACEWNTTAMMAAICAEAAGYFRDLDAPDFEEGWLNRAYQWP